jgi:hypothetical protein
MNDPNVRRDWEYYTELVQPLLREPGVELIGEVGGRDKDCFLRDAAALLFPICWPEPFGLVMAEALACGTPVLALRAGSVPEVIRQGITGFICDGEDELIQAVARIPEIDRRRCREEAEQRFSPAAMARAYERVYARVIAQQPRSMPLRVRWPGEPLRERSDRNSRVPVVQSRVTAQRIGWRRGVAIRPRRARPPGAAWGGSRSSRRAGNGGS